MTHNELQVRGLLLNVPDVRCHKASQCKMLLTTLYKHKICCPCSSVHATMQIYIVYILWKILQCSHLIHLQYQLLFSIKYNKTHATDYITIFLTQFSLFGFKYFVESIRYVPCSL